MNKITLVSMIFALSLLINVDSADASVFSWRNRLPSTKLVANIDTDWIFASVANKSIEMRANLANVIDIKPEIEIVKTYQVRATAYSSTPDQTDDSPFITAAGTYVRDGIVAANFLPFGTKVRIPDIYGNKIFVVEDRMSKRYWHNIDIWFADRATAKQFGVKNITIEVVSEIAES